MELISYLVKRKEYTLALADTFQNREYVMCIKIIHREDEVWETEVLVWDKLNEDKTAKVIEALGQKNYVFNLNFSIMELDNAIKYWWDNLEEEWQYILKYCIRDASFSKTVEMGLDVTQEDLRAIVDIDYINLECTDDTVDSIEPLRMLRKLKKLYCARNQIKDLTPIQFASELEAINITDTNVSDLSPLKNLINLQKIFALYNPIYTIAPIFNLTKLSELWITPPRIPSEELKQFSLKNPNCRINERNRS